MKAITSLLNRERTAYGSPRSRGRRSNRSPDERSDIRVLRIPAYRFAHAGYGSSPSLLQIALHLGAEAVAQIGAGHAVGDVGAQEAGLGAAIVALALEFDAVEFLRFRQADHRVGELNLAAGAALLGLQYLENLRLQDVAPGDR